MEKIRFAVCGLGKISRKFLAAVKMVEGCEVVACASTDKNRAQKYAKKYGIKQFGTYEEIAKCGEIDAVYVCNNMSDHYRSAKLFLSHGVPVLCEKSITQNFDEAKKLFDFANQKNLLIMEAMWTRFLPSTQKVIEIIKSGELGKVTEISGAFFVDKRLFRRDRAFDVTRGGGSILDLGVYPVSYTHFLLGVPQSILAIGIVKDGVDHRADFTLTYPDGATARLKSSSINFFKLSMKIKCERGTVKVPLFMQARRVIVKTSEGTKKYKFKFKNGFQFEIAHFCDLLRQGVKESPLRSQNDSLEVMGILTEINNQLGVKFQTKEL